MMATPRAPTGAADWEGLVLLKDGGRWLGSFAHVDLRVFGSRLQWAASLINSPPPAASPARRNSAQAAAFAPRSTTTHPYGLTVSTNAGSSLEICLDAAEHVEALATALMNAGVQPNEKLAVGRLLERPPPTGTPTVVEVNYYILQLGDIVKGGDQTFSIDFYVNLRWRDPRLVSTPPDSVDWSAVWTPEIEMTNAVESTCEFDNYILEPRGTVVSERRYRAKLSASAINLRDFPFDSQLLNVSIEPGVARKDEVILQMQRSQCGDAGVAPALLSDSGMTEWQLDRLRDVESINTIDFDGTQYSHVELQVVVRRKYGYYVKKITLIVLLVVSMSWSVFFIDAAEVADRIGISTTLGLTAVAFNLVASDALPRVTYMTRMDSYLTTCFVAIVFTVFENVAVYLVDKYEGHDVAAAVDLYTLYVVVTAQLGATVWFLREAIWPMTDVEPIDMANVLAYQERQLQPARRGHDREAKCRVFRSWDADGSSSELV